jgi:hypothetical protein
MYVCSYISRQVAVNCHLDSKTKHQNERKKEIQKIVEDKLVNSADYVFHCGDFNSAIDTGINHDGKKNGEKLRLAQDVLLDIERYRIECDAGHAAPTFSSDTFGNKLRAFWNRRKSLYEGTFLECDDLKLTVIGNPDEFSGFNFREHSIEFPPTHRLKTDCENIL